MLDVLDSNDRNCISCSEKTLCRTVRINRQSNNYNNGTNIITFSLCDNCLSTLATEFSLFTDTPYVDKHNDNPKMRKKGGKNGK